MRIHRLQIYGIAWQDRMVNEGTPAMTNWESRSLIPQDNERCPFSPLLIRSSPEINGIYKKRKDVEQTFVATKNELKEITHICRMMNPCVVILRDFSIHTSLLFHPAIIRSHGLLTELSINGAPEDVQNIHGQVYEWRIAVQGYRRYQRILRNCAKT